MFGIPMSDPFTIFVTWLRIFKTSETNTIDLATKLIKIVQLVHLCILQFSCKFFRNIEKMCNCCFWCEISASITYQFWQQPLLLIVHVIEILNNHIKPWVFQLLSEYKGGSVEVGRNATNDFQLNGMKCQHQQPTS